LINKYPAIIAISERAVNVFLEIFMKLDEIIIDDSVIPIFEKDLKVEEVDFGYSRETYMYEFLTPWIALNQKNFSYYKKTTNKMEREHLLRRSLIGNLLSMSKYLNYWIKNDDQIDVELRLTETKTNFKGHAMIGFSGLFKTNFNIPDLLGIGKAVSRGYGTVGKLI